MKAEDRLTKITELLKEEKNVSTAKLSSLLNVSEKTIRLDLGKLEKAAILVRTHGGASYIGETNNLFPSEGYSPRSTKEKEKIALKALELINAGDIIIIDDGSTTYEIAKLLGEFPVTVITQDLTVINELAYKSNVNLITFGGSIRRTEYSNIFTSEEAVQSIKKVRVNKVFLGTATVNTENGLMLYQYGDEILKKAFINVANEVICLCLSTKFDKTSFFSFAKLDEIDYLITDSHIDPQLIPKYEANGKTKIIIADE